MTIRRYGRVFAKAWDDATYPWRPLAPLFVLSIAGSIAMLVLLAAMTLFAQGAPAPVYREPAPLSTRVLGSWVCDWGSLRGTCELSPQGFWACEFGWMHWHGSWSLDGRVLTVRERRVLPWEPDGEERVYAIAIDDAARKGGGLVGVIDGRTEFRMAK